MTTPYPRFEDDQKRWKEGDLKIDNMIKEVEKISIFIELFKKRVDDKTLGIMRECAEEIWG
jgi:hypothetical protein